MADENRDPRFPVQHVMDPGPDPKPEPEPAPAPEPKAEPVKADKAEKAKPKK